MSGVGRFSKQELFCCICGVKYQASIVDNWHAFQEAVCGARCFYEKQHRNNLSLLNKPYRPDTREFDDNGRLKT